MVGKEFTCIQAVHPVVITELPFRIRFLPGQVVVILKVMDVDLTVKIGIPVVGILGKLDVIHILIGIKMFKFFSCSVYQIAQGLSLIHI